MLKFLEKVLDCLEIEKVELTIKNNSKSHHSKTIITVKRKKVKSKK